MVYNGKCIDPKVFITPNGMFGKLDNHRLEKECLDIYTYDSYPNFVYCLEEDPKNDRKLNDRKLSNSMHLDWNYALKYSILRID